MKQFGWEGFPAIEQKQEDQTPSSSSKRYSLLFVDDYSRMIWVYFLKENQKAHLDFSKNHACRRLINFVVSGSSAWFSPIEFCVGDTLVIFSSVGRSARACEYQTKNFIPKVLKSGLKPSNPTPICTKFILNDGILQTHLHRCIQNAKKHGIRLLNCQNWTPIHQSTNETIWRVRSKNSIVPAVSLICCSVLTIIFVWCLGVHHPTPDQPMCSQLINRLWVRVILTSIRSGCR